MTRSLLEICSRRILTRLLFDEVNFSVDLRREGRSLWLICNPQEGSREYGVGRPESNLIRISTCGSSAFSYDLFYQAILCAVQQD
jgi:hypothetical protein